MSRFVRMGSRPHGTDRITTGALPDGANSQSQLIVPATIVLAFLLSIIASMLVLRNPANRHSEIEAASQPSLIEQQSAPTNDNEALAKDGTDSANSVTTQTVITDGQFQSRTTFNGQELPVADNGLTTSTTLQDGNVSTVTIQVQEGNLVTSTNSSSFNSSYGSSSVNVFSHNSQNNYVTGGGSTSQ